MTVRTAKEEILVRGRDDWMPLSEAYWLVKKGSQQSSLGITEEVIGVLEELITDDLMQFGTVTDRGFEDAKLTADVAIERLRNELAMLGREPVLGEIGWLANTPAGDEAADEILSKHGKGDQWVSDLP